MGISLGTWLGLLWGSRAIVLAFTSWDSPKGLRGWLLNRLRDIPSQRKLMVVGAFPSWTNVRAAYRAVGDGMADQTRSIQRGLMIRASRAARQYCFFRGGLTGSRRH